MAGLSIHRFVYCRMASTLDCAGEVLVRLDGAELEGSAQPELAIVSAHPTKTRMELLLRTSVGAPSHANHQATLGSEEE
jgi:hypothetical protein